MVLRKPIKLSISLLIILLNLSQKVDGQNNDGLSYEIFINTDNDALGISRNYDRYYTYGIGLGMKFKANKVLGLEKLFSKKLNYFFETEFRIEGYTADADELTIQNVSSTIPQFSRPFAGLLYGEFMVTYQFSRSFLRLGSTMGIMGPSANAGKIQKWFHESITDGLGLDGWRFQLPDQGIFNFRALYVEDFIVNPNWFDLFTHSEVRAGNLYMDSALGFGFKFGKFQKNSKSAAFGNSLLNEDQKTEFFFISDFKGKVNFFNATIQGNLFGPQDPKAADRINLFSASVRNGLFFSTRNWTVSYEQFFTFGEVILNDQHFYSRIAISCRF